MKEVTAAVLTTKTAARPPFSENDEISRIENPQIIIAANPENRPPPNQVKGGVTPATKTVVWAKSDLEELDTSPGVVAAVLKRFPKKAIAPFHVHVGWSHGLLKKCHAEAIDQTSYAKARQDYRDYVYLACYPKMQTRLKWGHAPSNFLVLLTASVTDFNPGAFDRIIDSKYETILPTADQASFIKGFSKLMDSIRRTENDPTAAEAAAETRESMPLYNQDGRRYFHSMLSFTIQIAIDSITHLASMKADLSAGKATADAVFAAVQQAQGGMTNLNLFIQYFGKVPFGKNDHDLISLHLSWLAQIASVTGRTDEAYLPGSDKVMPEQELPNNAPGPSELPEMPQVDSAEKNEDERGGDVDEDEDDTALEDKLEQVDLSDEVDSEISDTDRPSLHGSGWARGVLKYLDICCLHEQSFQLACPSAMTNRNPAKSLHIRSAKVTVVDVELYKTERHTMETSFQAVLKMDPKLANSAADLRKTLEKSTDGEKAKDIVNFWSAHKHEGKVHCETILMTAMYLMKHKSKDGEATLEDKAWLERNGIFGIDLSLLRSLRYPLEVLIVSKRCCPPCNKVFELMREEDLFVPKPNQVAMPGYHTRWAVTVLPPFMFKKHVEAMLTWTKDEALKRMQRLHKEFKENTSSSRASAGGSGKVLESSAKQDPYSLNVRVTSEMQEKVAQVPSTSSPRGPPPPSDPAMLLNAPPILPSTTESASRNLDEVPHGTKRGADDLMAGNSSPTKKNKNEDELD